MARKLKHNHKLMLLICCGVPFAVLLMGVYFFGLNKSYLFWFALLLCPLLHYFMMKDAHKNKKEKGGCH